MTKDCQSLILIPGPGLMLHCTTPFGEIYFFIWDTFEWFKSTSEEVVGAMDTTHSTHCQGCLSANYLAHWKSARELCAWLCLRKSNPGQDLNPGPWGLEHSTQLQVNNSEHCMSARAQERVETLMSVPPAQILIPGLSIPRLVLLTQLGLIYNPVSGDRFKLVLEGGGGRILWID